MVNEKKVKEEQRMKCRKMMRECVKERQSCSLCHVHTAYDSRQRERVKETECPTESELL